MKTLFLLLISTQLSAQLKWYKFTWNDAGIVVTSTISGVADATNQMVIHHRYRIDEPFWNNKTSWQRKYKSWPEDTRSAYPFSKNLLVWTTDGFHLTRFVQRAGMTATLVLIASDFNDYDHKWLAVIRKILTSIVVDRLAFGLAFK